MRKSLISTITAFVVILALFGIFAVIAWRLYHSGQPSEKLVIAAITFVGAFITAVGTVFGIVLKYSTDVRAQALQEQAAERLRLESDRNDVLQRQAEDRLKLEAAMEAVKLLARADGELAPDVQRAGALFTLASLGAHQLTVELLRELMAKKQIETATASRLINVVITKGDEETQREAAWLLFDNAETFLTPAGFEFPESFLNGDTLPTYVREWTALALVKVLVARPLTEWQKVRSMANTIIAALVLAWLQEQDTRLRRDLGAALTSILAAFADVEILYHPKREINVIDVKAQLTGEAAVSSMAASLSEQLGTWSGVVPAGG